MSPQSVNVENAVNEVKLLLAKEVGLSPALRAAIEVVLMLVSLMVNQLTLNSRNSSKPPSGDPNRKKKKRRNGNKPGGQAGRGSQPLKPVDDPDEIQVLSLDPQQLPGG